MFFVFLVFFVLFVVPESSTLELVHVGTITFYNDQCQHLERTISRNCSSAAIVRRARPRS